MGVVSGSISIKLLRRSKQLLDLCEPRELFARRGLEVRSALTGLQINSISELPESCSDVADMEIELVES